VPVRQVQAQLTGAPSTNESYRRAATIRALDQFRDKIGGEDGVSEITAYAAKPLRDALDEMLEEINVQRREHLMPDLMLLRQVGTRLDAVMKEPLKDDSGGPVADWQELVQQRAYLEGQRRQALDAIGSSSDLDVDSVIVLCDRLADAARSDLQGRYTD
jgi:hypothetical protein